MDRLARVAIVGMIGVVGCGDKHDPQPAPAVSVTTPPARDGGAAALASEPSTSDAGDRRWEARCYASRPDRVEWDTGDLAVAAGLAKDALVPGAKIALHIPPAPTAPKLEHTADETVELAARGDLARTIANLTAMPPMWDLHTDSKDRRVRRSFGSPAVVACVAIAPSAVAHTPQAHTAVEVAERATSKVKDDWRRNREWHAIAIAYARLGDPEHAISAAAHMPGTERGATLAIIAETLDPKLPADRFAVVTHAALAALTASPTVAFVIPKTTSSAELQSFAQQATAAEVVAAVVEATIARGDLATAATLVAAIPTNLVVHARAAGTYACARSRSTGPATEPAPTEPAWFDAYASGMASAGCGDPVRALIAAGHDSAIRAVMTAAIDGGRPELAAQVFADHHTADVTAEVADQLCEVLAALRAGERAPEAAAVVRAFPDAHYPLVQQRIMTCGFEVVPALVLAGKLEDATALDAELSKRAATVP